MCGLFGHTNVNRKGLIHTREALHTQFHRGPDQWDDWFDEDVYLGHSRLSILDLSENGKQPMSYNDEIILTANGEIYNYKELREELENDSIFGSESDSEVLLQGYRKWGIETLLEKIDGMFAFTIFDKTKKKLFLVRDRVGIKPLYYANIKGTIAWASELKAMEKYFVKDQLEVDNSALYDFLTYSYIPTPKTLYKDIFKLEPAHFLEIDIYSKKILKKQYWQLKVEEKPMSIDKAATEVRSLIKESVKEQLMSDVPVGFFLSGGMDSSVIVAEASDSTNRINTYSIGFDVESHNETQYAEIVAKLFKTYHIEKILDQHMACDLFLKLRQWYDEPFADTSAFPTFLVSELARQKSKVVLTGDGGDELFGGYNWYSKFNNLLRFRLSLPPKLKSIVLNIRAQYKQKIIGRIANKIQYFLLDDLELYTKLLMGGLIKEEKKEYANIFGIPEGYDDYWYFRKYYRKDLSLFTRLQYLDFHTYLPDDVLTKVDRASMSVSLEARVPFLSKKIIEFIFSVPEEIRYVDGKLKGLLKYAYKDILPLEIIDREKKGFGVPTGNWDKLFMVGKVSRQEQVLNSLYL